ncbi:hypothetical protein CR513_45438, partial [Mucuna pruriens]
EDLKQQMREKLVPSYYKRELFVKLQKMYQGSRSVEEYFKEMESQEGSTPFKGHRDEVSKVNVPNSNTQKSSNVKCFKCLGRCHITFQHPNKRIMILREDGNIDSESSHEKTSTFRSVGYSSDEVSFEGDFLMVRRLMSTFVENDQSQQENIFSSRSMVKDGGSNMNVANFVASQSCPGQNVIPIPPKTSRINLLLDPIPNSWAISSRPQIGLGLNPPQSPLSTPVTSRLSPHLTESPYIPMDPIWRNRKKEDNIYENLGIWLLRSHLEPYIKPLDERERTKKKRRRKGVEERVKVRRKTGEKKADDDTQKAKGESQGLAEGETKVGKKHSSSPNTRLVSLITPSHHSKLGFSLPISSQDLYHAVAALGRVHIGPRAGGRNDLVPAPSPLRDRLGFSLTHLPTYALALTPTRSPMPMPSRSRWG